MTRHTFTSSDLKMNKDQLIKALHEKSARIKELEARIERDGLLIKDMVSRIMKAKQCFY